MRRLTVPCDSARRTWLIQASVLAAAAGTAASARAAPAQRIVSIGGALTEMVFAIGAEPSLVGIDTTSLYPEGVRKLPNVGYARALSAEGVLALAPTQVIATEDAGPPAVLRQIGAAGVPVAILSANHRFEGVLERLQRVGELTSRVLQATAMALQLREDWARAQAAVATRAAGRPGARAAPRVLFVLSHSPSQVMVAGAGTSAEAMIEYAGAVNALAGFKGYKPLTPEAVIAARPDLILATDQGLQAAGGAAGLLKLPGLAQTPAGRPQRIVALEATWLLGFGPRLPAALQQLDAHFAAALKA